MKRCLCVSVGLVVLLMLMSCQSELSEPISEERAWQIALEHIRDSRMYRVVGYDPSLLPPPYVHRFDRGMTFDFKDTLQNVSIFFVVYDNGTTRYDFRRGWYDEFKELVKKTVSQMYQNMSRVDTSLIAGRYVSTPDTLDINADGTYIHRLLGPNDSVYVDTGTWRLGEPTDFSNTIIFDSIRFDYISFYTVKKVLSEKGVALLHHGVLKGDTVVAFARPAFPTKDVIPDGCSTYSKRK